MTITESSRNDQELRETLMDYVAYVLTSAAGLYREPLHYGPMRMVDSLEKSLKLMRELGFEDATLEAPLAVIRENRWCAGTDAKQFSNALDEAIITLVKAIQDNNKVDKVAESK